jgi:hypothetical protein
MLRAQYVGCFGIFRKSFCGFVRAGEDGNYSEPIYQEQHDNFEEHVEGF